MNKVQFKKFYYSLACSMAMQMTYVPILTLLHQVHAYGFGMVLLACFLGISIIGLLTAYLLYMLIGDVGYMEVDQDRRLRGLFSLFVTSMILLALYMYFFEEAEPMIRWCAWIVMVIILFIAAYSICKQYIMKNE